MSNTFSAKGELAPPAAAAAPALALAICVCVQRGRKGEARGERRTGEQEKRASGLPSARDSVLTLGRPPESATGVFMFFCVGVRLSPSFRPPLPAPSTISRSRRPRVRVDRLPTSAHRHPLSQTPSRTDQGKMGGPVRRPASSLRACMRARSLSLSLSFLHSRTEPHTQIQARLSHSPSSFLPRFLLAQMPPAWLHGEISKEEAEGMSTDPFLHLRTLQFCKPALLRLSALPTHSPLAHPLHRAAERGRMRRWAIPRAHARGQPRRARALRELPRPSHPPPHCKRPRVGHAGQQEVLRIPAPNKPRGGMRAAQNARESGQLERLGEEEMGSSTRSKRGRS